MTTAPLAELITLNTRSRFAVLETASKHPGKCAVCGAPNKPVLDLGCNIPMYGFVMICFECVSEAGQRIGLVLPTELEDASLQAGQSVETWLAQRDYKVISSELYEHLSLVVGMFIADVSARASDISDCVDDEIGSSAQGVLEFDKPADESGDQEPDGNVDPFNLTVGGESN